MQALYGYFTAVEAIKEVKRNELRDLHALDPAKHDFADKALFEERKKLAVRLFDQNILKGQVETSEEVEEEVLQNVNEALSDFQARLGRESNSRRNEMMKEARQLWEVYLKLLQLPIEIEHREKLESDKEDKAYIAKAKKHYPFINDEVVQRLKESETFQKELARSGVSWANELDEIKIWYKEQIRTSESLAPFFEKKGLEEVENGIVLELFKRVVFKNEVIMAYMENAYLHWQENQPILKSMVVKTLKGLQDGEELTLAELTKNGEDDFKFLDRLFKDVVDQNEFLEELIQSKTKNWDVDRIALTDRVILKLSLVEMMNAPSIPVKVTINEAIEISKVYSTPKSKQFVNGVLDVLSNELTSRGKIRKSGRGLIDNK